MSKSSLREARARTKTVEHACHWLTASRSLRTAAFDPGIRISRPSSSPFPVRLQTRRRLEFTNVCHVSGSARSNIRRDEFPRRDTKRTASRYPGGEQAQCQDFFVQTQAPGKVCGKRCFALPLRLQGHEFPARRDDQHLCVLSNLSDQEDLTRCSKEQRAALVKQAPDRFDASRVHENIW
jgi:hypothetical protein